jgi:hypothetical protein
LQESTLKKGFHFPITGNFLGETFYFFAKFLLLFQEAAPGLSDLTKERTHLFGVISPKGSVEGLVLNV